MNNQQETQAGVVLGQRYAYATVSLVLGITCYTHFLGMEKAILAIIFGILALKANPAPPLQERRAWAKTGIVPLPAAKEKLLGGHANMLVGYNDATSRFLSKNSWGAAWGMAGYFTIPYDYLTNSKLASDFWVVSSVEG